MTAFSLTARRKAAWALAILLAALAPGHPASAAIPAAYVVADVPADATAKDGASAKEAARLQGQQAAFRQLLQRLTQPADWPRLPQPDAGQVTQLLVDFQVANEHASASRYIANFTFRFNPKAVRDLLNNAGIPYSELGSKPVVIVPVLDDGQSAHLWDDPNPWREAWNAVPGRSGIVPWTVPPGDLGDVTALDAPDAEHPTPDQLQALSRHYDDADVVVALARQSGGHLDITITRYGADGTGQATTTAVDGAGPGASLYLAGVGAAVKLLEEGWKSQVPVAGAAEPREIEISVAVAGAEDWPRLRDRLAGVPVIRSVEIELMTRHEIRLMLTVAADPATLKLALAQQDLGYAEGQPFATISLKPRGAPPAGAASPGSSPT